MLQHHMVDDSTEVYNSMHKGLQYAVKLCVQREFYRTQNDLYDNWKQVEQNWTGKQGHEQCYKNLQFARDGRLNKSSNSL